MNNFEIEIQTEFGKLLLHTMQRRNNDFVDAIKNIEGVSFAGQSIDYEIVVIVGKLFDLNFVAHQIALEYIKFNGLEEKQ